MSKPGCNWLQAAGVPTVPGSDGLIKDEEEAMTYARKARPGRLH